jgi:hypothetical protein
MLSIPSLRWLRFVLNLTGLGVQSVHVPRAKLFSIQFPLPLYMRFRSILHAVRPISKTRNQLTLKVED